MDVYAFWKYDIPPYLLCGQVIRFTNEGNVVVKGYDGMAFKPVAIYPIEKGKELREKLDKAHEEYREEVEKAIEKLRAVCNGIVQFQ